VYAGVCERIQERGERGNVYRKELGIIAFKTCDGGAQLRLLLLNRLQEILHAVLCWFFSSKMYKQVVVCEGELKKEHFPLVGRGGNAASVSCCCVGCSSGGCGAASTFSPSPHRCPIEDREM